LILYYDVSSSGDHTSRRHGFALDAIGQAAISVESSVEKKKKSRKIMRLYKLCEKKGKKEKEEIDEEIDGGPRGTGRMSRTESDSGERWA
jgi:hypothetical protein